MTPLTKPVRRTTFATVRDKSKRRVLTVSLLPGDVLEFRPQGTRYRVSMPIESAFRYAEKLNAIAKAAEKRAARKARTA
jgi:hypothetical protein